VSNTKIVICPACEANMRSIETRHCSTSPSCPWHTCPRCKTDFNAGGLTKPSGPYGKGPGK
jgi:uncharacterized CHY-type Zn-finger protein